jgi:hypothetical protein
MFIMSTNAEKVVPVNPAPIVPVPAPIDQQANVVLPTTAVSESSMQSWFFAGLSSDVGAPVLKELVTVESIKLGASDVDGGVEVHVIDFRAAHSIRSLLNRVTVAEIVSVTVHIPHYAADYNIAIRIIPHDAALLADIIKDPDFSFVQPYSVTGEFSSKMTVPVPLHSVLPWPTEGISRTIKGFHTPLPLPALMVSVQRDARGLAKPAWPAATLRVRITLECRVAGHGIWLTY